MARRGKPASKSADELAATDTMPGPDGQEYSAPEEDAVSTTTEADAPTETNGDPTEPSNEPEEVKSSAAPAEAVDPEKLTDEQLDELLKPFSEAMTAAAEARDEDTGSVSEESIAGVNAEYSKLAGAKLKNRAKARIDDGMKDAMNSRDIKMARAYMDLRENLSVTKAKKAKKESAPREPVNPTDAFTTRAAVLNLAYNLTTGDVPEGVDEEWADKASAKVAEASEQAAAYRTWLESDADDKGDEPETNDVAKAAVKLSLGRSAKPGKTIRQSNAVANPYAGPRRNIGKHIEEAFADKESGTFLRIAEIGSFKSSEYGDDHPSPGAISARLFPSSGKCTLDFVTPGTNAEGNKGATKN